ncbi:MAG: hypothetical protein FWD99_08065 [Oscillospiraceae bacterium]|nr:hypothetical protein [Oscillospiraceae bacterium]
MDVFAKLSETYKEYEIRIESIDGIDYFIISNPFWDEDIWVSNEDGIIFWFWSLHKHFDYCESMDENIDCLIACINDFLDGKWVSAEFFRGDTALGGSSRRLDDIDMSSRESLIKSFAGSVSAFYEALCNEASRCLIRGWDNAHNKDIDFLL